ncbi:MAG: zinc-dependent alcohol dehydrogenase family protein [Steroidobacteraceae bacterium]
MKVAQHSRYGDPAEVLEIIDVAPLVPAADEVIVRMEAAALHIADLRTIQGVPPFQLPLPRTPGFEGIGRVSATGSAVTNCAVGDRVFPALRSGTFREELACKAADCLPAPEGDAVQLSLLTVNAPTAEALLHEYVPMQRGDWLIQNAANSNCGRFLIRLARLAGVHTVNVVRRPELLAELKALGADVVLEDGDELAARVAGAVAGAPIKLGIDAVAGAATQRIAECLDYGGTVVSYGSMTNRPCELDFYLMFSNDIRLRGAAFARDLRASRSDEQIRAMYARLADLLARGELSAKIAGVYPLRDIVAACRHAARTGAERDGKIIISLQS